MARELYEGFALQAVDEDKGRVAIPADLRAAIERNSDLKTVVVGKHPHANCLTAHDQGWSQQKYDRIDDPSQSMFDAGSDGAAGAKRRAFGAVERSQFDGSGRFILSPFFRAKAKIGRWAFFCGTGDSFEIWSPEVLMATTGPEFEDIREICEFLCQQKGVAL
ncbi:division/cell wall cluster transcriptional repressor MraZ [Sphingomonas sp.]|uniref:division/cell wall cluster transcriptional repressor MraZ n=1 Tax=Sphingomonas sp. TaxID=28214 RepID=UPI001B0DFCC6|nr:division/cell wall cluster transcriptional repressor MraZ [Sphingomonas sp.]MBO9714344.1 division/cell wall cluster transcriptional repressor MraZ [Sphingomonas sp.]